MQNDKLIIGLVFGVIILFGLYMLVFDEPEGENVAVAPLEQPVVQPAAEVEPGLPEATVEESVPAEVELPDFEQEPVTTIRSEQLSTEIEALALEPALPPLPALDDSDAFLRNELAGLDGAISLIPLLADEEIIRKFVLLVDNVSQGNLPDRNLPFNGPGRPIQVRELEEDIYVMDESSYQRFTPIVNVFTVVETDRVMTLYRRFLPLLQAAYDELGYRENFSAVLLRAIDNVLNARTPAGPFRLIQPVLNFEFEDPAVENLSGVEKLLLRIGPENTARLRQGLELFRGRLVSE